MKLFKIIPALVILILLFFFSAVNISALIATANISFKLTSSSTVVSSGQEFAVDIWTGTKDSEIGMDGYLVTLDFDTQKVKKLSVDAKTPLGAEELGNCSGSLCLSGTIINESQAVALNGFVKIATVNFQALPVDKNETITISLKSIKYPHLQVSLTGSIRPVVISSEEESINLTITPGDSSTPTPAGLTSTPPPVSTECLDDGICLILDPSRATFLPNSTFEIALRLNTRFNNQNYRIAFAKLILTFPKDKLRLELFTPSQSGLTMLEEINPIDNDRGLFNYHAVATGAEPSGSVTLGILKFKALMEGTAEVNFKTGSDDLQITSTSYPGYALPIGSKIDGVYQISAKQSITKYRIAESEQDLDSALDFDFTPTDGKVRIFYTLADKTPGRKRVWVRFYDSEGKSKTVHADINYLPGPVLKSIKCEYDPAGLGTKVVIKGQNFGQYNEQGEGGVLVNSQQAAILDWGTEDVLSKIVARVNTKIDGRVPIKVTFDNGKSIEGICGIDLTSVSVKAIPACRPPDRFTAEKVDLKIYEATSSAARPFFELATSLDSSGGILGFEPKLEIGKKYVLLLKAVKSVAKKVEFTAEDGTTVLGSLSLPVGDIFPAALPDGVINSLDKAELIRQWTISTDVNRSGDFNLDGRINSIDYSCMKQFFNQSDEKFTL